MKKTFSRTSWSHPEVYMLALFLSYLVLQASIDKCRFLRLRKLPL